MTVFRHDPRNSATISDDYVTVLNEDEGVPRYFDHNHLSFASAQNLSRMFDFIFHRRGPKQPS